MSRNPLYSKGDFHIIATCRILITIIRCKIRLEYYYYSAVASARTTRLQKTFLDRISAPLNLLYISPPILSQMLLSEYEISRLVLILFVDYTTRCLWLTACEKWYYCLSSAPSISNFKALVRGFRGDGKYRADEEAFVVPRAKPGEPPSAPKVGHAVDGVSSYISLKKRYQYRNQSEIRNQFHPRSFAVSFAPFRKGGDGLVV